jgi:DNA-binding NarL/FixJ family response regulator
MRIVVVDDHVGVAEMTSRMLAGALHCDALRPMTSLAEATTRLPREAPDLVLLDNRLEDGRGVELFTRFKRTLPDTRWLMCSAYLSAHTLHEAFALGINGTVSKRAPKHVLVHAAREVLAGRGFQCEFTARELRETPACKALSDSERRILRLVADGCEAKEIAAELGLSQKTVLNNLVSLRQKSGL